MKFSILIIILFSVNVFAGSSFSGNRLEEACFSYIKTLIKEDIKLDILSDIPDQRFSQENVKAKFNLESNSPGINSLQISFEESNTILKIIEIPVRIKVYKYVPVASRNLDPGVIIGKSDIVMKKKLLSSNETVDFNLIIGTEATRSIKQGECFTPSILKHSKIIEKGDMVNLKVFSGKILINSTGKAMNDGAIGDMVRVKRDNNSGIVQGMVYSDGSIVVRGN